MKLGYCGITWGGVTGHAAGVTSVKDLFYVTHGDTLKAASDIAEVGYEGIEVFDGDLADFEDNPDVLLDHLKSLNLELVSVYCGANFIYADILDDELHRLKRSARLARQFGAKRLVVGGGAVRADGPTDEDYAKLAAGLDLVADIAEAEGLDATYHPHLGTIVERPDQLERLMPLTRIGFCPDTAHLAAGGGDPAALIRKYQDRVRHVHLKDYVPEPFSFQPLGKGTLDFTDILHAIKESGYSSWLMVELDNYDGDPKDAAAISKSYLENLISEIF